MIGVPVIPFLDIYPESMKILGVCNPVFIVMLKTNKQTNKHELETTQVLGD